MRNLLVGIISCLTIFSLATAGTISSDIFFSNWFKGSVESKFTGKNANFTNLSSSQITTTNTLTDVSSINANIFTNLSTAVNASSTINKSIVITDTQNVNTLTVPSNRTLEFRGTGNINIASGNTVTINGNLIATGKQIFSTTGSVVINSPNIHEIYPEWWGAKADGVWVSGTDMYGNTTGITCTGTNSTTPITLAIAAAQKNQAKVVFGSGTYLASQISIDSGVQLIGQGTKKTAAGVIGASGTVLKQINGTNADFLSTPSESSWIESASIRGIRFIGDPTGAATAGSGLVFNKRVGENTFLDDVRFDFFPVAGIKILRGVQPCVFNNVHLFWNGYNDTSKGSGLYITRDATDEMQSGAFTNISGDSNKVALIYIEQGMPNTSGGGLTFINVKAETGETDTQQDVFVFDNALAMGVAVIGCANINSGSPEVATNSIFKIKTSSKPALTWSNISAESETAYILDDTVGSIQLANTGGSRYANGTYNTGDIAYTGITFGNPTPSSTDTAFLDYYKESTFTPSLTFASGNDHTYSLRSGKATRIGDTVFYSIQLALSSKGTSSGDFTITGLPYTSSTQVATNSVRINGVTSGVGDTYIQSLIAASSTAITLSKINAGGAVTLNANDLGANASIITTGLYFTVAP